MKFFQISPVLVLISRFASESRHYVSIYLCYGYSSELINHVSFMVDTSSSSGGNCLGPSCLVGVACKFQWFSAAGLPEIDLGEAVRHTTKLLRHRCCSTFVSPYSF